MRHRNVGGESRRPPTSVRPDQFRVRLDTTKGIIVIDCVLAWAPVRDQRPSYLKERFPLLDYIRTARVEKPRP